jgi:hypothetical protein
VHESPFEGAHVYDTPPVAFNVVDANLQIETFEPALITGSGFTDTVIVPVLVQLPGFVPVIVYVLIDVGLAVTVAHVVHDNPEDGDHV